MPARKMRVAMKRLMDRCRWIVVLGLLMERIREKVRMQRKRQTSEMDRPTQVISCRSNFSCWQRRVTLKVEVKRRRRRRSVCAVSPPSHKVT